VIRDCFRTHPRVLRLDLSVRCKSFLARLQKFCIRDVFGWFPHMVPRLTRGDTWFIFLDNRRCWVCSNTMTQSPSGHYQPLLLSSARQHTPAPSTTPPSSETVHDPSPPTESTMPTQSMMLRLHATPLQRITRPSPTRAPVALMSSPTVFKSCGCNRTRPTTPCTAHLALRAFPTDVQLQLPVPTTGTPPDVPTLHDDAPHPPVPIDLENITCNA